MGRSNKELRDTLARSPGVPKDDTALIQQAVPSQAPIPIAQTIKQRSQQLRAGLPRRAQ